MIKCYQVASEDMGFSFCFGQFEFCPAHYYFMPEFRDKLADEVFQVQCPRPSFYNRYIIDTIEVQVVR